MAIGQHKNQRLQAIQKYFLSILILLVKNTYNLRNKNSKKIYEKDSN